MAAPANIVVLIPAYNPTSALVEVVRGLLQNAVATVVVIDDGSSSDCLPHFDAIRPISGVHLLRHAVNLGKGAALKTGLNFAYCNFPQAAGFVTADADGQHAVEDIIAVARKLAEAPAALI